MRNTNKDEAKADLIALVDKMENLRAVEGFGSTPEIRVTIARKDEKDGKPRNWSLLYDEQRKSAGGCFFRMFASQSSDEVKVLGSWHGPEISYGDLRDYEHAARACKLISSRLSAMYELRGNSTDAAEELGRFLEACGVSEVFCRPDGENASWLSEGNWQVWSIGRTVIEARHHFPKAEVSEAVAA